MRRARRCTRTHEKEFATLRRGRRPRAGRRSEPEQINGPCSQGGALPLSMQVRLSDKDGELGPLHVLWASSLLRGVREWRVTRERCRALSCLQWRAGGAARRSRCLRHDDAPKWFATCLPIRYNCINSGSSSCSARRARCSTCSEKGTTSGNLNVHSLPAMRPSVRWRVLRPKGRILYVLCPAHVAVPMGSWATGQ